MVEMRDNARPSPALKGRPSRVRRVREGNVLCHPPVCGRVDPRRGEGIRRHRSPNRDGYVMVLFAMLLFGIMAMAALVIDIGSARLAQRQMQTATESAALEGLRGQGVVTYDVRQANAETFIAWQFDDDLDATNGDDGIAGDGGAFGAGPIIDFSGGAGDPSIYASQLMTADPDNAVYKPVMQRGDETPGEFRVSIQRGGDLDDAAALFAQGPSVPYLFARGSLINRQLIGAGITVRLIGGGGDDTFADSSPSEVRQAV